MPLAGSASVARPFGHAGRARRRGLAIALCLVLGLFGVQCVQDLVVEPHPPVTVSGVSPNNGPLAGGTAVTTTGTNFPTTIDSVRVGTGRLGSLVRVSGTQLTGTTPASSTAGAVDVTVYTTSAGSGSCTGCFTYNPPVTVTRTSLTAGGGHTCGLTSGGAAYCWGGNGSGQLGDGSTTQRPTPVAVAGGITFASLAPGGGRTCGVTSGGAGYCWGVNSDGQLGDGSTTQRSTPVAVAGGLTFASLTAGGGHTCGVTSGGAAYCWGVNFQGQLGDGST
ncbi:MAG: IPT/TIG domain-containing protein, partial [Gemmatimonadales bacterium]|nr:IPT/TIG domain-containing protein [Gemmatimonadales bacterium]